MQPGKLKQLQGPRSPLNALGYGGEHRGSISEERVDMDAGVDGVEGLIPISVPITSYG